MKDVLLFVVAVVIVAVVVLVSCACVLICSLYIRRLYKEKLVAHTHTQQDQHYTRHDKHTVHESGYPNGFFVLVVLVVV